MNAKGMASRFSWASDFPWILGVILVTLGMAFPTVVILVPGWGLICVGCILRTREAIIAKLDEMSRQASAGAQHVIRKELKGVWNELQERGE